jgi:tetratricopeptide (TPR) repeat protein
LKRSIRQAAFFLTFAFVLGCSRKAEPPAPAQESIGERATMLMQRALERRKEHRWNEALGDYEIAQRLAPDDPDVHRGVKIFERLAKFLGEIRELDARIAVAPDDDQTIADRAMLFLRADDPELALMDAKLAAEKAPWAVRPKLFQALTLIALERPDECEPLGIDKRIHLNALSPEFLETISRLDAEISVERENADLYTARAWQLNEIGQPRLALNDAETALQFNANSADAHAERSYALTKLGRGDEAFDAIKRATELDANLASAWQYRGELELARDDFAAAIESLSHALTIAPTFAALQKRELAYRKLGDTQKADEDLHALEALGAH